MNAAGAIRQEVQTLPPPEESGKERGRGAVDWRVDGVSQLPKGRQPAGAALTWGTLLMLVLTAVGINHLLLPDGHALPLVYAVPLFWMARVWGTRPVGVLVGLSVAGGAQSMALQGVPAEVAGVALAVLAFVGGMAVWAAHLDGIAKAAVDASRRGRDEFVAAAAHDLKNPLAAIRGQVFLLRRHTQRLVGEEAGGAAPVAGLTRGLEAIDRAAARTLALLNALMDAVRLHAGEALELVRKPTDLVALTRDVVAAYQAGTDRHEIEVRAEEAELVGTWDGFRLERVLENLLSNAIKYSPGGGAIVVDVGREAGGDGAWAVVVVRDHGVGIPAADLRRVFQPYRRGRNAARVAPGTGIGLAGARRIVEQHGGAMAVSSVEGRGSTFAFRVPLGMSW